jgi:hypothetical protein
VALFGALVVFASIARKGSRTGASKLCYLGTEIEVRLGDHVRVRHWFFCWRDGIVCYLPGVSPPHPEMVEENGLEYWAIDLGEYGLRAWAYLPNQLSPRRAVKFVARGKPESATLPTWIQNCGSSH